MLLFHDALGEQSFLRFKMLNKSRWWGTPMRLAGLAVSLLFAIGCSGGAKQIDLGGVDGTKVALLVEELNELKHNSKKMVDCFVSKQAVPDSKKFNQLAFYIVGKPNVTGTTATCKVLVEKAAAGTPLGEQEWTFEKVADEWKIKSAPVP
jgi:hypothetical protein